MFAATIEVRKHQEVWFVQLKTRWCLMKGLVSSLLLARLVGCGWTPHLISFWTFWPFLCSLFRLRSFHKHVVPASVSFSRARTVPGHQVVLAPPLSAGVGANHRAAHVHRKAV